MCLWGCRMIKQSDVILNTHKKFCSRDDLKQVIISSYDAIMVTDGQGNIILCNPATGKLLDLDARNLIGKNVRDLRDIYSPSIALQALESGKVTTGMLKNRHGSKIMATATPILDDNGQISIIVVNSRDVEMVEKFLEALDKETEKSNRYKTAAEYLSDRDISQQQVVAKSKKMLHIIENCSHIAKSDSTVMLYGESGTGKEVMARYIHRNSLRSKEPFIPVNCAAIPSELLESEFFGYVAGAFTGANSKGKPGLLEIAHKGTLFLDEIGDLPLSMQSKLLRVIETGEVQRLGSTSVFQTSIRLVAATNRDLQSMVQQKLFRSDLYYRLNVIPIELPPLRDRPEDILVLAEKFLDEFNKKYALKKEFTPSAVRAFLSYNWPGNVRELRNVIERLVVTSTGDSLDFQSDALLGKKKAEEKHQPGEGSFGVYEGTLKNVLKKVEEEYINQVLAECNGRIGEAAQRLGIHRTMLYRKTKVAVE